MFLPGKFLQFGRPESVGQWFCCCLRHGRTEYSSQGICAVYSLMLSLLLMILFTRILGALLIVLGIVALVQNPVLGLFQIDSTLATSHIITGIIALGAAFAGKSYTRLFLIVFGILWALLAIIGFVNNGDVFGLLTTNRADSYVHAVIALASLWVGFRD